MVRRYMPRAWGATSIAPGPEHAPCTPPTMHQPRQRSRGHTYTYAACCVCCRRPCPCRVVRRASRLSRFGRLIGAAVFGSQVPTLGRSETAGERVEEGGAGAAGAGGVDRPLAGGAGLVGLVGRPVRLTARRRSQLTVCPLHAHAAPEHAVSPGLRTRPTPHTRCPSPISTLGPACTPDLPRVRLSSTPRTASCGRRASCNRSCHLTAFARLFALAGASARSVGHSLRAGRRGRHQVKRELAGRGRCWWAVQGSSCFMLCKLRTVIPHSDIAGAKKTAQFGCVTVEARSV